MTQRLKRWESPRREGRNDKGKGGSARARQLKKQQQMLRRRLKEGDSAENNKRQGGEQFILPPVFLQKVDQVCCSISGKKVESSDCSDVQGDSIGNATRGRFVSSLAASLRALA